MPVTVCPTFILLSPRTNKLHSFQTGINMATSTIKTCKSVDPKEELLIDLDAHSRNGINLRNFEPDKANDTR